MVKRRRSIMLAPVVIHLWIGFLIAKGAGVNIKSYEGSTPLHMVSSLGHVDVAELFIAKGADINANNKNGSTTLHEASNSCCITNHHASATEALLHKGADINSRDNNKDTPLHHFCVRGSDCQRSRRQCQELAPPSSISMLMWSRSFLPIELTSMPMIMMDRRCCIILDTTAF